MTNDAIMQKLREHDTRFDRLEQTMATKGEMGQILTALDNMMIILQRLDHERVFTHEWIKRVEGQLERQQQDIDHLKTVLKVE
jgi:hypothetical protein